MPGSSQRNTLSWITSYGEIITPPAASTYSERAVNATGNYRCQPIRIGQEHADFGYLKWRTHGPDGDDARAALLGISTPEDLIRAFVMNPSRQDLDNIFMDWVPGRLEGSRQTDEGRVPLNARSHITYMEARRERLGLQPLDLAQQPFTWAGSDRDWYMRPGADASVLHAKRTRDDNGSTTVQDIESRPEWNGRTLFKGKQGGPKMKRQIGLKVQGGSHQPSVDYLQLSQRTVIPGGPFAYIDPPRQGYLEGSDGEPQPDNENVTSFHPGLANMSWRNLPEIMYRWQPTDRDTHPEGSEPPQMEDADGRPMFDLADPNHPVPILDYPFLPHRISTAVTGEWLEVLFRLSGARMPYNQILARMPTHVVRPTPNSMQMARSRSAKLMADILQAASGGDPGIADRIVKTNSTRGITPGLIDPARPRGADNWKPFTGEFLARQDAKKVSQLKKPYERITRAETAEGGRRKTRGQTRAALELVNEDKGAWQGATKKRKRDEPHSERNAAHIGEASTSGSPEGGKGSEEQNGDGGMKDWGVKRRKLKMIRKPWLAPLVDESDSDNGDFDTLEGIAKVQASLSQGVDGSGVVHHYGKPPIFGPAGYGAVPKAMADAYSIYGSIRKSTQLSRENQVFVNLIPDAYKDGHRVYGGLLLFPRI
ncbi:hypothetical protein NA57DRAFT_82170 [Rhizodiscina lignyota]|uniref:Uncharacterized protein n=1 Tax=Rhizodiscina lignyota TaxID=1504668 RepID=A0A9P4I3Q1_9PEZI|nr:hypothetical protein NA57DRAFT_82170 [Rhizodiscina lignyota]